MPNRKMLNYILIQEYKKIHYLHRMETRDQNFIIKSTVSHCNHQSGHWSRQKTFWNFHLVVWIPLDQTVWFRPNYTKKSVWEEYESTWSHRHESLIMKHLIFRPKSVKMLITWQISTVKPFIKFENSIINWFEYRLYTEMFYNWVFEHHQTVLK